MRVGVEHLAATTATVQCMAQVSIPEDKRGYDGQGAT